MANPYEHLYYLDYPHTTVGDANQWYEWGFFLYEDKVLQYEEDRKDQYHTVSDTWHGPCDFLAKHAAYPWDIRNVEFLELVRQRCLDTSGQGSAR
jgi:hypothetical protein